MIIYYFKQLTCLLLRFLRRSKSFKDQGIESLDGHEHRKVKSFTRPVLINLEACCTAMSKITEFYRNIRDNIVHRSFSVSGWHLRSATFSIRFTSDLSIE